MRCALLTLLAVTQAANAAPRADSEEVPHGKEATPLVVVLHGDREHAPAAAERWRAAVKRRGWAMLALECPASEGCGDSWWKWNGEPAWVIGKVDAFAKKHPIDRAHIYLIGWSGGASYMGARAAAWSSAFAAVVFHGGGMAREQDCPSAALPAYFLVGDKNPLHRLAVDLRGYFDGCKQEVVWDLVKGGDHAKEEAALTAKKADAVLGWLAQHTR